MGPLPYAIDTDQSKMENSGDAEPNFDDPEGFVDDVGDEELLGDLLKQRPREADATESVIIVDGAPVVGPEKLEKLQKVITTIFSPFGNIVNVHFPRESDGTTKGYCFIEYGSKSHAQDAFLKLPTYKLDKQHILTVNLFSDMEKYLHVSEKWEPPKPRPYKDVGNLKYWLLNQDCYDQFAVLYEGGEKVGVYTNTPSEPTLVTEKMRWTETRFFWSPKGSYLATIHEKGIALWGGQGFEQIIKFAHAGVEQIDFSPCETYLVTYAHPKSKYVDMSEAVRVWDVRTGEMKRAFPGGETNVKTWPYFKWNHDDKYFACLKTDMVSVFETETFMLLDKKSIKIDGVRDFCWSPTDNYIAYWVEEKNEIPARFALMNLLDRTDLRTKNVFNASDVALYWQKSGDHLCAKVDRYSKKKTETDGKVTYTTISHNLEVLFVRAKNVPVESYEIKEPIQCIAWEPVGTRLAVIHGEIRFSVTFFTTKGKFAVLKNIIPKQQVNHIYWAPPGQYCVLAGLKSIASGVLMFVDASDVSVLNTQEHTGVSDVEWDPTGRFVATAVSSWHARGTYGYMLWNFQGRLLQSRPLDRFCQLLWRPRPSTILPEAKIKEIKKNMKKYSPAFEEKDKMTRTKASKEIIEKRQNLKGAFEEWRSRRREQWELEKPLRIQLRGFDTDIETVSNLETEKETETFEYLISEKEEVLPE